MQFRFRSTFRQLPKSQMRRESGMRERQHVSGREGRRKKRRPRQRSRNWSSSCVIPPKIWNSINGRGTTLCKLSSKLQAETAIFRALHPHAIVGCRLPQVGLLRPVEVDPVHIPVFLSPQSTVRWSATFAGELADIFHHRPQRQYRIQAPARNSSLTPQQHFLQSFQHHNPDSPDSPFKAVVD